MVATGDPTRDFLLRRSPVRSAANEGLEGLVRLVRISRKSEWRQTVSGPGSHPKYRSRLEQSCLSVCRSGCPVLELVLALDLALGLDTETESARIFVLEVG